MDELSEEGVLQLKDFKKVRVYLAKQVRNNTVDDSERAGVTLPAPRDSENLFSDSNSSLLLCGVCQHEGDAADPAELQSLADEEQSLREKVNTLKSANTRLSEQMRALQNEPSDDELASLLVKYTKEVDALNQRLARIKGDSKQVSKEGMDKAQTKFNEYQKAWSKRKRAARDIIDGMCGEEGNPSEVTVRNTQTVGAVARMIVAYAVCSYRSRDCCVVQERLGIETDEDAEVKLQDWTPLVREVKKAPVISKK